MNRKRLSAGAWCIALSLVCWLTGTSAFAQNAKQPDESPTIQTLLNEVRLLRRTLQQTGLNAYRSQLIVEGLRKQNERVDRLTGLLEKARDEIERIGTTIPRMTEQAKLMETLIEQETDASNRTRLEFEAKEIKRSIEQYKVRLEQQREREQQLGTQLRAEENKLRELESRLDALDREIETEILRLQSDDGPQEVRKRPD